MNKPYTSIPYTVDRDLRQLSSHKTLIFENIPSEEDFRKCLEFKRGENWPQPNSVHVRIGATMLYSLYSKDNKYILSHESSYLEGTNHYVLPINYSSYNEMILSLKSKIENHRDFLKTEVEKLSRILLG